MRKYWWIFQEVTDFRILVRNNFRALIQYFEHSASSVVRMDVDSSGSPVFSVVTI